MQKAEVVLSVLRERGRKGQPCAQLYRQMFNKDLYLLAYGNIYSNQGAMTPGIGGETADGMSRGEDRPDRRADAAGEIPVFPGPPRLHPEEKRETPPARHTAVVRRTGTVENADYSNQQGT
jgi:hypothetical protein